MAVYSVPTATISFSAMKTWSPSYSSNSSISLKTLMENMYPDYAAPYSISSLRGQAIRYGYIQADAGGVAKVSYPYLGGSTSGTSPLAITPINYGSYGYVNLYALPTYPATFHSWRTAASGGGSSISTSQTLTLDAAAYSSQTTFYAHFNV
jgi:hypothetical protein